MKSTIRVKHDFTHNEPYLQVWLDKVNEDEDMRDEHLNHLFQLARFGLLYTYWNDGEEPIVQVRPLTHESTTEECMHSVILGFESFARPYFQDTEMDKVDAFFSALRTKVMLKYDKIEEAITTPTRKL